MAKIIPHVNGIENILVLINAANPELFLSADQVTMGTPTNGEGELNTNVEVTGVPGRGFKGSVIVKYNRLALVVGSAINQSNFVPIGINLGDPDSTIFQKACLSLGVNKDSVEIVGEIIRPIDVNTPGSITVRPISANLLYYGAQELSCELQVIVRELTDAAYSTDLNGFDAE